jgi:thiol:disulfide interchange protein DsbC
VKIARLVVKLTLAYVLVHSSSSLAIQTKSETKIQSAFGDKPIVINDYNEQLKEVVVDGASVYFATHDGQYIFAGPIFDTEQRINILSLREDQLRLSYLRALPDNIYVKYPSSSTPSKYEVTVFTDIDCGYCRKFHSNMARLNKQGISVKYIMLPRSGVGTKSHTKTIAALCSDNPAETITRAMQNIEPIPNNCEGKVMRKHMEIVQDLKINNTPTIVLPNGQIKLGLYSPERLLAVLKEAE